MTYHTLHPNGTFVLLKDGIAQCYSNNFHAHIVPRLNELFKDNPSAEYLIAQVVGTVDKPKAPVINSIYMERS